MVDHEMVNLRQHDVEIDGAHIVTTPESYDRVDLREAMQVKTQCGKRLAFNLILPDVAHWPEPGTRAHPLMYRPTEPI